MENRQAVDLKQHTSLDFLFLRDECKGDFQKYQEERSSCDDLHGSVHGLALMEGEEQEDLRGAKGQC